jgi:hypothetical protein
MSVAVQLLWAVGRLPFFKMIIEEEGFKGIAGIDN